MEQEVESRKEEMKRELFAIVGEPTKQLEFIDAIERLGLSYHFEEHIEQELDKLYHTFLKQHENYTLYHVSLGFRIFRQHGIKVSCDVFKRFMTKKSFNDILSNDLEGILSLYEACHVEIRDDDILDEALTFATSHLKSAVNQHESPFVDQIVHALHQPLHTGFIRLESRHYITFYEQNPMHNTSLLRLAKLDFNLLLSMHQMELKDLAIWWKALHGKLPFTRDRSVECYFWVLGCYYEPQYALARKIFGKMFMVVQIFDDIYDTYGTIEEKQLLVEAVDRWDYNCVDELPVFFKECYIALLESCYDADEDLAIQGRSFCLYYWKKKMKQNCKAWFKETKWCKSKYIPTYEEYMEVALVSVGQSGAIVAACLGMGEVATKEAYEWLTHDPMPKFIEACSIILRLLNDIGGHKFEQGREHVASSIECYMRQHDVSEEVEVYEELERQVKNAWKVINEGMLKPYAIPKPLLAAVINLARGPEVMYKGRTEGYTFVNYVVRQKIASVLIHPIPP
ncbi:hypothetical protein vseg_007299 [Gypsophila vaccaria]